MASASTRPRRTPRVHYHDDDSESGDYNFTSVFTPRPTRDVSRVQTYRESSDDDSSVPPADEADSILDTEASPAARESHPSQGQNIAPPKKSKVYHATRSKVSKSSRPSKRQKTQTAGSATESIAQPAVTVWTTSTNTDDLRFQALPLHILLSIMRSAAYVSSPSLQHCGFVARGDLDFALLFFYQPRHTLMQLGSLYMVHSRGNGRLPGYSR